MKVLSQLTDLGAASHKPFLFFFPFFFLGGGGGGGGGREETLHIPGHSQTKEGLGPRLDNHQFKW